VENAGCSVSTQGPRRFFVPGRRLRQSGWIDRNSATGTPVLLERFAVQAQKTATRCQNFRGVLVLSSRTRIGDSVRLEQINCPYWARREFNLDALQLQPGEHRNGTRSWGK